MTIPTTHSKSVFISVAKADPVTKKPKEELAVGTGFFVKHNQKYYVIANYHTVTGAEIDGRIREQKNTEGDVVVIPLLLKVGGIGNMTLRIPNDWKAYYQNDKPKYDIVSAEIGRADFFDIESYANEIANELPNTGDECYTIGFPGSYINNTKDIFVGKKLEAKIFSNERTLQICKLEQQKHFLFYDVPNEQGASGSPVYNATGHVVGIHRTTIPVSSDGALQVSLFEPAIGIVETIELGEWLKPLSND